MQVTLSVIPDGLRFAATVLSKIREALYGFSGLFVKPGELGWQVWVGRSGHSHFIEFVCKHVLTLISIKITSRLPQ